MNRLFTIFWNKYLLRLNKMQCTKNIFAFTLAETLAVVGIIGVIAALTLPNLNQSTGNKETVVKLQKLYSDLNNAYGQAIAVYGPIHKWPKGNDHSVTLATRMLDFMKNTKYCPPANTTCYPGDSNNQTLPSFVNADGSAFMIWADFTCSASSGNGEEELAPIGDLVCGSIPVDIDGPGKGPNTAGVDRFIFLVSKRNGILPRGGQSDAWTQGNLIKGCFKDRWAGCTGWVIENGNMDYLKADSNGKCKDSGVTLSWTNTSCK